MKKRKPRFRSDELLNKKVSELKDLAATLGLNITGFIDKKEMVEYMIKSGKIDITEGIPVIEFSEDELLGKSVGELRNLLKSFGLSDEGALEKKELRARLLESNRVVIVDKECKSSSSASSASINGSESTCHSAGQSTCSSSSYGNSCRSDNSGDSNNNNCNNNNNDNNNIPSTPSTPSTPSASASTGTGTGTGTAGSGAGAGTSSYSSETLRGMTVTQLKLMAQASGVSLTDCSEKQDIVDKLVLKVCPA